MATSYTTNLGLALPVTGELSGTWGDVVNNEITSLIDSAIAGTTVLSADADVTLTDTDGSANQSRQAIILWTASGTATRTITAPARTKTYVVINATGGTQSIKLIGAGSPTGVTLVAGERCVAAWDGSDFTKVATTAVLYPAAGLAVSTGSSWGTSKTAPSGDVVGTTDSQTLTNKVIVAATLNDGYTEEVYAVSGTTPALSPTNGSIQTWTLSGNSTPTAGTWAAGQSMTLMIDDGSAYTVTWSSLPVTWKTNNGLAPTLNTSGYTAIVLWKVGTTIYGARVGDA